MKQIVILAGLLFLVTAAGWAKETREGFSIEPPKGWVVDGQLSRSSSHVYLVREGKPWKFSMSHQPADIPSEAAARKARNGGGEQKVLDISKIKIDGRHRRAHRVSYELHVGEIPADREIEHRCHNTRCVNPAHLRIATHKENCENKAGAQRNSRTGVRGVVETRNGRFKALVQHCGRQIYVGTFDTLAEADAAAKAKRRELFTHSDADLEVGQLELFGSAVSA